MHQIMLSVAVFPETTNAIAVGSAVRIRPRRHVVPWNMPDNEQKKMSLKVRADVKKVRADVIKVRADVIKKGMCVRALTCVRI